MKRKKDEMSVSSSEPPLKKRRRKMICRTIELAIPRKKIEDVIAAHLYATRAFYENQDDITKIEFGEETKEGNVKLTITFKKEEEVEVITHN